ncbi:type II toxin-antitoxin system Phd/YefM family antitoxin [Variovorax sp. JS1663]|uniref:type II toxin-antitoxin system Phd/YefM family antitoxin n=1 Tax=Variovorax sp. JS1663 TaxID=1851577 RepID=UPI000B349B76|nr:type II toxin-antitoxin system Phd/YefM family antitoxin [Variovorax sp. JS1663]OUM00115.1 hypothetical protein A8M77_23320 [Variovorax sp. JS1663]
MTTRSISNDEFEARIAEVMRWAVNGPVFILDQQGEPTHVLLDFGEYKRLVDGDQRTGVGESS